MSCKIHRPMPRRSFRLRPDGVIQIHRRVSALAVTSVVSGVVLVVFLFVMLLTATLLASPALLAITAALALPGLWGAWLARSVRHTPPASAPTAPRPPPRRAA